MSIIKTNYKEFSQLQAAADAIGLTTSIQRIGSTRRIKNNLRPGKPMGKKRKAKPVVITTAGPLLPMALPEPAAPRAHHSPVETVRRSSQRIRYQVEINGRIIKVYNKRLSAKQRIIKEYNKKLKELPPPPRKRSRSGS